MMLLKMDIVSWGGDAIGGLSSVVFDMNGGTIGRSKECHLELPDELKSISRNHAQVFYENGRYYLMDTSKAGTLISNRELLLQGDTVELEDGDRLRIGDYELLVSLVESPSLECDTVAEAPRHEKGVVGPSELCIDDFFASSEGMPIPHPICTPQPHEQPASTAELEGPSHEDAGTSLRPPVRESEQTPAPDLRNTQKDLFDFFLKGARFEEAGFVKDEDIPEMMETLGAVFREMVSGLWTVLQGRMELKSELRIQMTRVSRVDNNPLKLCPRVEDAMRWLMKHEHPSYLEPVDAVSEGFEDLMHHQLAMNAGIQASWMKALEPFDPEHFARRHKGGMAFRNKCKCWDDYCKSYEELRNAAGEDLFGMEFVRAYEEQIEKLRRKNTKS